MERSGDGVVARGSFIQTLVLTDIATAWTECAPLIAREQTLLSAVLTELRKQLPFALVGLDTDNDIVLMNARLNSTDQRGYSLTSKAKCLLNSISPVLG